MSLGLREKEITSSGIVPVPLCDPAGPGTGEIPNARGVCDGRALGLVLCWGRVAEEGAVPRARLQLWIQLCSQLLGAEPRTCLGVWAPHPCGEEAKASSSVLLFFISRDKETWWEEPRALCWDGEDIHCSPDNPLTLCFFVFSLASPELQPHIAGPKRDNTEPRLPLWIPQLCKLHVDNHC